MARGQLEEVRGRHLEDAGLGADQEVELVAGLAGRDRSLRGFFKEQAEKPVLKLTIFCVLRRCLSMDLNTRPSWPETPPRTLGCCNPSGN